jgi:3-deoxy-D-manno-octulosonate 8-phosphate phosphatase (KDO 8-P phosphatase)
MSADVEQRASRIKLLLMDCDGVLTDGRIWLFENGEEQKGFHTRDGLGLALWHRAGFRSGIISGNQSSAVDRRAQSLGISFVIQGCEEKQRAYIEMLSRAEVSSTEVAYIGDDLNDLPLMLQSGLGIAVADAALETREHAHYITKAIGGYGAVREAVELILKAQGRWAQLTEHYLKPQIATDS